MFRTLLQRSWQQGREALYVDARFYDHFYRRRTEDVRMYVELARRHGGPVLELGVGTGRVAAALARSGIDVVGIDAMRGMLAGARERIARLPRDARERVRLQRADMRRLALGRRFALVIAPFNTFTHLFERADVAAVLRVSRSHLAARGRLVFDVPLPDLRALLQDPARLYRCRDFTDPSDGQRYRHHEASHYDAEHQVRTVTMVFSRRGDPARRRVVPLVQRQFFPAELETLLHYNGLTLQHRYGDFAFGPMTERSETQVIVATRTP